MGKEVTCTVPRNMATRGDNTGDGMPQVFVDFHATHVNRDMCVLRRPDGALVENTLGWKAIMLGHEFVLSARNEVLPRKKMKITPRAAITELMQRCRSPSVSPLRQESDLSVSTEASGSSNSSASSAHVPVNPRVHQHFGC